MPAACRHLPVAAHGQHLQVTPGRGCGVQAGAAAHPLLLLLLLLLLLGVSSRGLKAACCFQLGPALE